MQEEEILRKEIKRLEKIRDDKVSKKAFQEKEIESLDESIEKLEDRLNHLEQPRILSIKPITKDHLEITFLRKGEKKIGIFCYHTLCEKIPSTLLNLDISDFALANAAADGSYLIWYSICNLRIGSEDIFDMSIILA